MNSPSKMKPSPALVIACVALAVALSGTSYAAFVLPANSVGAKQLKKRAVTTKKLATGAVVGAKVKDDSLTGADIQESTLGEVAAATNAATARDAGALNGYPANGLARVARSTTSTGQLLTFSSQAYGAPLSITAPSAGFVLVTGSYTVGVTTNCTYGCVAMAWIRHVQDNTTSNSTFASLSNFSTSPQASMALAHVFPVAAGVSTFELRTARGSLGGDGALRAESASLTGLFVPFGSTGGSGLGTSN